MAAAAPKMFTHEQVSVHMTVTYVYIPYIMPVLCAQQVASNTLFNYRFAAVLL